MMELYAILWGKNIEMIKSSAIEDTTASIKLGGEIITMENDDHDLEMQLNEKSNGNHHHVTTRDQEKQQDKI